MTKDKLINKLGKEIVSVIEANYDDFEYDYEKFISYLEKFTPILESKGSSMEEVCQIFNSNIAEPIIPIENDEEGNPLEDVLTIPRSGEPLINVVKKKGWITPTIEKEYLESFFIKGLIKKNLELEPAVLNEVTQNSLHILGRSNNPKNWGNSKQGMVIGMVQSGKTMSMLSLMGLGMASGYNLFILLAGDKESLREQLQNRVRKTFDLHNGGYYEEKSKKIKIISPTDTSGYSSIRGGAARKLGANNSSTDYEPIIIITILKEISNLKKLNEDIAEVKEFYENEGIEFQHRYKTLILDDESDYASLNVSKNDITKINEQLVKLRKAIPMNCYIGYTATPQGCLAANTQSLVGYPKDFLWLLEPMKLPDDSRSTLSYMGLHEFFLQFETDIVKSLSKDAWPHHVKDIKGKGEGVYNPITGKKIAKANLNELENEFAKALINNKKKIPQEFLDAIIDFLIGCGIRWFRHHTIKFPGSPLPNIDDIRNDYPYHAMMFNLSLTKDNHDKTRTVINKCWNVVFEEFVRWKRNAPSRFDHLWAEQVMKTKKLKPKEVLGNQNEIQKFIELAIKVAEAPIFGQHDHFIYKLNSSDEGDVLNYNDVDKRRRTKKCAIFMGGNILSRGLTIENLSVSVFVRTQAMSLGDTNLQMCRWFGHKKKDVDIISLYIMDNVRGLFKDIAVCDDALRMSVKTSIVEGKTPDKVLIELWSSNLFNVTSPNKRRLLQNQSNSAISYSGKARHLTQPFCSGNLTELTENINLLDGYLSKIKYKKKEVNHLKRGTIYYDVDCDQVINFLSSLKIQKEALFVSPSSYVNFLLDWHNGYTKGIINNPLPIINVGMMGTGKIKERQREFSVTPTNAKEAKEQMLEKIGSLLGGTQRKANYKGDRFFDKDQLWHTKNMDIVNNERSLNEPILILFYKIDPNFLITLNSNKVKLTKTDPGYVNLKEIFTFATITPLGGPTYRVFTHKMINQNP